MKRKLGKTVSMLLMVILLIPIIAVAVSAAVGDWVYTDQGIYYGTNCYVNMYSSISENLSDAIQVRAEGYFYVNRGAGYVKGNPDNQWGYTNARILGGLGQVIRESGRDYALAMYGYYTDAQTPLPMVIGSARTYYGWEDV